MQTPIKHKMKDCIVSPSSTSRRSWEEDMYWTHSRSLHFCQFLSGDFNRRLAIPKKFVENIGKKLPESVIIKGPSGETWDVGLVAENDDLFFKCGWEDFAKTYCLVENDLLMFKYNGESSFDVLMFNRSSLCEKEVSYFQRKCEHGVADNDDDESGAKRKREDDDTMILHATPTSVGKCTSKEDSNKEDGVVAIPLGTPVANGSATVSHRGRPRKEKLFCSPDSKMKTPKKEPISHRGRPRKEKLFCNPDSKMKTPKKEPISVISWITSEESMQESIKKSPARYPVYKSNRRPVTGEEVSSAYNRALGALTSEGFLVVMRPTHVYKRFYLSVPVDWAWKHLGNRNRDMVLRFEELTWNTKYAVTGRGTGGLQKGWKAFSMDNHLEESDVCVFDLAKSVNDTVVLDVTIFRVVEDVGPYLSKKKKM